MRRARKRASDLGVSFAEYLRRLVTRDLVSPQTSGDVSSIFDLGSPGGSDIARNKDAMIAEAFRSAHSKRETKIFSVHESCAGSGLTAWLP